MPQQLPGLSALYYTLLHLIDEGQRVEIDDAYAHIEAGDTIEWLTQLAGEWEQQTGFLAVIEAAGSRAGVQDFLERHDNAVSPGDVAVAHNGLCLLLGFCLNEMQSLLAN